MMRRWPVAFDTRWQQWLLDRNRRRFATGLWIALALYPCFGILDVVAGTSALRFLWTTRAVVIAGTVLMFGLRSGRLFDHHPELLTAGYTIFVAGGISAMTIFIGGMSSEYYAGLSLVIVGAGLLFVWRPVTVCVTRGAGPNVALPAWSASTTHVPTAVKVTSPAAMVQPRLVESSVMTVG